MSISVIQSKAHQIQAPSELIANAYSSDAVRPSVSAKNTFAHTSASIQVKQWIICCLTANLLYINRKVIGKNMHWNKFMKMTLSMDTYH